MLLHSFDGEELGSIFFAKKTDVLRVLCFNNFIKEKFESLMLDEFPNDAEISGNSITI